MDPQAVIGTLRGRIKFLEQREAELVIEEATLPTRGRLRAAWEKAKADLTRVRQELDVARGTLAATIEWESEPQDDWTSEERRQYEEAFSLFEEVASPTLEQQQRAKSNREAARRRSQFRVIKGGKV